MLVLDRDGLGRRLSMAGAIEALEVAFREGDPATGPLRTHVETAAGSLLLMPATGDAGVGVKLVTVTPANPSRGDPLVGAVYVLFGAADQQPRAVIDGAALTALRTAAVSGLATRHLAREDAARLVLIGAGVQADAHLDAMIAVRPIERVTIVSRGRTKAEALRDRARALGIEAGLGGPDDLATCDLVCACTTSPEPVVEGRRLSPGTHVNAVGSYQPHTRELDAESIRRAKVVVEERAAAFAEAGELVLALAEGAIDRSHVVADLREVVRGRPVRTSPEDVTIFKSVGLAFEDLAVATAAVTGGGDAGMTPG
jgi:ornithine cyclodeaminase/alanine dehydrogenase-like protein (mu-crystallin family)